MHQCHKHYLLLLSLKNGRCSGFEYHFQTIDSLNMCVSTVATVPLTHSLPHATRPFIRRTSSGNVHCAFSCTLSTYSGVLFLSRGTSSNSASVVRGADGSFHSVGESASNARPQTQWTLGRMRTSTTTYHDGSLSAFSRARFFLSYRLPAFCTSCPL